MKLVALVLAIIGTVNSVETFSHQEMQHKSKSELQKVVQTDADNHLAQLVTTALAGAPPGEIAEPDPNGAKEGANTTTNGHTYKNYQYFWKYTCAFTKWVPTNQFLFAN